MTTTVEGEEEAASARRHVLQELGWDVAQGDGSDGGIGVFHADQLQAKCASKYGPAQPGQSGGSAASPAEKAQAATPAMR